jgi:hypothetical protein
MRYLLFALVVAGCGIDRNIESKITIRQGVYGLLVRGCDTSGCQDQPDGGEHVIVYSPGVTSAFATTTSDADGVFQIDLPPGDYTLCTYSCTPIAVAAHATVRYDWTSGPGGGQWQQL